MVLEGNKKKKTTTHCISHFHLFLNINTPSPSHNTLVVSLSSLFCRRRSPSKHHHRHLNNLTSTTKITTNIFSSFCYCTRDLNSFTTTSFCLHCWQNTTTTTIILTLKLVDLLKKGEKTRLYAWFDSVTSQTRD